MERSKKFVNRKYFQRLLTGLLVFILFLQLPFSFAVLRTSRESVLNNINTSNQTVLEQLHQNYTNFSDNISSLTTSIFSQDDIQKILYSPNVPYEDVYFTLRNLYATYIVSHPDLQSICLYSKYSQELYVVSSIGSVEKVAFLDFVKSQESISPLQPMLHELSMAPHKNTMVFSHFMFQFNDPSQTNESFLVLNQYADQTVSTIDTFSGTSDSVPTATYYITEDAYISSKVLSPEVAQDHEELIEKFRQQKDSLPLAGSCYEDTVGRNKYLLTYIHTKFDNASFVIIQDYDTVFQEINTLTRRFWLITSIFTIIAILLAFFISQQLYKPIDSMYDLVAQKEVGTSRPASRKINELDMIRHAYQDTRERNQALEKQGNRYAPIALQYGISSLLLKNNSHGIEQFRRAHPNHWLSTFQEGDLHVVLLKPILSQTTAMYSDDTDLSLLLFGLQNVSEELLAPNYNYISFRHARDTLGIVASPKAHCPKQALYEVLEKTRDFMNEHFTLSVAATVSSRVPALSSLHIALQEAVTCLSYIFLLGPTVITNEQILLNEGNNQTVYPSELDAKIEECIAAKDTEECKRVLSEIKTVLCQFSVKNAVICTTALLNQVQRLLNKYPSTSPVSESPFPLATIYGYISGAGTIDQCFDAISSHIHMHLSGQNYESKTTNDLFISTVFAFVQNSYFDYNLSSQLIADHLGLSNRYLMKKFKALTGTSLNEYITDLRLKMAAMFLRDTDNPIANIAEQVGIDNLSYFYRLFKRSYGCTPKEFRENGGIIPEE